MDNVAEPGVVRGRRKVRVDFVTDLPEPQTESVWIVRTADKTVFRIR